MDFSFSEDQKLIAETANSFLASACDSGSVREMMQSSAGFTPELWATITQELGWQLTLIPEQHGGLGLGYVEACILAEAMGKTLCGAPMFSTQVAINTLNIVGTHAQQAHWLPKIALGEQRMALAYCGASRKVGTEAIDVTFTEQASGYQLNGTSAYVVDGHSADTLCVAALDEAGRVALFVVDPSSEGVEVTPTPTMDQTRKLAKILINDVSVGAESRLGGKEDSQQNFAASLDLARILLAAEQLGVAEQALKMTVEYIAERKQFGRAVGSFQAMKHKAADMMNKAEAARSAVYYAACIADEYLNDGELGSELAEAASIAKAYSCDAAFFNAGCAIQMHGGVGFTWEYDVHLYFKRAKAAQVTLGDSSWHRERLATILLEPAA